MARVAIVWQHRIIAETRVGREIGALAEAGHEVDVICLRAPGEARFERRGPVTFRRLSLQTRRSGLVRSVAENVLFGAVASLLLSVRHLRRPYSVIQVDSVPDTLVFAAIGPRLLGARVVLELLEPMPEFFASRFRVGLGHPVIWLMRRLEQASIRFAHSAITCTTLMRDAFVARGAPKDKVHVIHDGPDERVFKPDGRSAGDPDGRFTLICHGTVEERYGLDTVIRAVALLKPELPGLRFQVVGQGSYLPALEELARTLGVSDSVHFTRAFVPAPALVEAIGAADAGVVAMKRDAFRDLTLCAKLFDFIAMRKPILASRTRSVEEYFDDSCLSLFTADDAEDLARAIRELHADPKLREAIVERATLVGQPYRWPSERPRYLEIIEGEIARARPFRHRGRSPGATACA
jgi:glycosyltransferase involved in cell wall biosynthesis